MTDIPDCAGTTHCGCRPSQHYRDSSTGAEGPQMSVSLNLNFGSETQGLCNVVHIPWPFPERSRAQLTPFASLAETKVMCVLVCQRAAPIANHWFGVILSDQRRSR